MEHDPAHILEQYIAGKDQGEYQILEAIYERSAEVEFEINSTDITFPSKIIGNRDIAKILSADFNEKYEKIKTYYLSKKIFDKLNILEQPWLVVMKEIGNEMTRVGSGYYNWKFRINNNELKIIKHKIYIHTMLELHDAQSTQLQEIQENLEYPWVGCHATISVLKGYGNLADITNYLIKQSNCPAESL